MRYKFIDALRGFTMFLVVFWHVLALSLGLGDSILGDILGRFRMPLFFFISGFIGYKALDKFSTPNFSKMLRHKAFVQLVPTFIIFSFFQLSVGGNPINFFHHGLKGFWFTLVLFEMYAFYYISSYLFNKMRLSKLQDWMLVLVIPVFWLISIGIGYMAKKGGVPNIFTVLCISNLCMYLPFFAFGLILRKYESALLPIITNKKIFTAAFIVFAIGFLLKEKFLTKDHYQILYHILDSLILRFSGLIFVFGVFYHCSDKINESGVISKTLQYIGKRTLDIYLLHYFLIPDLSQYGNFFVSNGKEFFVGEIFIAGFGIALPIIAVCLLISYVLRMSPILEKYLFGIVPRKVKIEE